jgi:hypothetical protein
MLNTAVRTICFNSIFLFQGFCREGLRDVLDGHCCPTGTVTQELTELDLLREVPL